MADPATTSPALEGFRARTFASLAHSGFRLYLTGQGVSLIGTWLQAAAVRWLVFELSGSETLLGVVETASLVPGVFVGLIAGVLADRIAPKRMIILMECGQMLLAFLLALLVWLGAAQIWQMILILAVGRVCVTFELPSRQIFFYDLVGPATLSNAIALNSGMFNATRVIGPALAGIFLVTVGAAGCFALNGASFLAAIAAIMAIDLDNKARPLHQRAFDPRDIWAGIGHLRSDRRMGWLFLVVASFGVVGMGYDAMIPAFAAKIVGTGVGGYSVLMSSGAIGATVGAILVASRAGRRRKDSTALLGIVIFACSLAAAALLPWWAGGGWHSFRLAGASACLLGAGFGAVLLYASSQMIIQLAVPDVLRGRVMGVWMIMYSSSVPLGALWTGMTAQRIGVAPVMGASAALCLLMAAAATWSGVIKPPRQA